MLISLIIFFVWPFGGFLYSFYNRNAKVAPYLVWFFVAFYGYTFVLSNDTMDANSIKEMFDGSAQNKFTLSEYWLFHLYMKGSITDVIQPLIIYGVSKISSNFQVLMGVLGAFFGYFYAKNVFYLLQRSNGKLRIINYSVILVFSVIVGFWEINAFRFWTAALIFFHGVIPYIYENKKKQLFFLVFCPLIHFSFLFPLFVFCIYILLKNRPTLYFIIFVSSLFLTIISLETFGKLLNSVLPSFLHGRINSYTNPNYADEVASRVSSISSYLRRLMFMGINISFVIFYSRYLKKIKANKSLFNLFNFSLLLIAFCNFISVIPSGGRFIIVGGLFALAFIFFFMQQLKDIVFLKPYTYIMTPILLIASLGFIRLGLNTIGVLTVFGNPILALFVKSKIPLIDLLPFL